MTSRTGAPRDRDLLSRRSFVRLIAVGIGASASGLLAACAASTPPAAPTTAPAAPAPAAKTAAPAPAAATAAPAAPAATSAPAAPAATAAPAAAAGQPVSGGTLTIAMSFGTQLDVNSVLQIGLNMWGLFVHDGLFDWDATPKTVPMLVKEDQVSSDGLTVTWKLQPNVKFHDGTPFNAAAVKFNLERKIEKKLSPFDLLPFKTVEVVDELTTRIKLDRHTPPSTPCWPTGAFPCIVRPSCRRSATTA